MMASTIHSVSKYTVQILNMRGDQRDARSQVIIRLYNQEGDACGMAVFKDYGDRLAENPSGDPRKETATAYFDMAHYQAFIDILRLEKELYWKIAWQQTGASRVPSDVSLDTKEEIIGDHFGNGGA